MPDDNTPPTPQPGQPPAGSVTPEALKAAIEKARLEERDKLRNQIDAANAKTDEVTKQNTQLQTQVGDLSKQVQTLTDELKTLKTSIKPEGGVDVEKAISTAVTIAVTRVTEQFKAQLDSVQSELSSERASRQQLTLNQLKAQLIEEHGGANALIPELVVGSNADELLASIANSKAIFQRTVAGAGGGTPPSSLHQSTPAGGTSPVAQPVVVVPVSHPAGGTHVPVPANAGRLPMSEYAKNREALKRSVSGRYPKQVLTQ